MEAAGKALKPSARVAAAAATLGLAIVGLAGLAVDPTLPFVAAAIVLIAVGLGAPYAALVGLVVMANLRR